MAAPGFVLETERFYLRRLVEGDVDALAAVLGDAEAMRYYPHPFSRRETADWIDKNVRRYEDLGFGLWAIVDKATGELLGDCGPTIQIVEGIEEVELGWHVLRRRWREGIATEAAGACRDYAFQMLGIPRLIALVREVNVPSRGVAEKIGMTVEKEVEHAGLPHLMLSMTRPRPAPADASRSE